MLLLSLLRCKDIQFSSFKMDKIPEFENKSMSKGYVCWTTLTGKETLFDFAGETNILYEAPYLLTKDGVEAGLSHVFHVKLFNAEDTVLLEKMATEYHVAILGHGKYMPALWYTLTCTKESKGNSMHIANLFYESKLFASAVPELMTDDLPPIGVASTLRRVKSKAAALQNTKNRNVKEQKIKQMKSVDENIICEAVALRSERRYAGP